MSCVKIDVLFAAIKQMAPNVTVEKMSELIVFITNTSTDVLTVWTWDPQTELFCALASTGV